MMTESEAILASNVFQRSPVLSGLLRYLVEETIAGRASTLKSFIVAIDALGRKADFDSTSDSSARVQMGRLRKTLESYYAENAPTGDGCLYLLPASYIVRLDPREVAYPMLPDLMPDSPDEPVVALEKAKESANVISSTAAPFYRQPFVLPLLVMSAIALAAAVFLFAPGKSASPLVYYSPILEVSPVDSGGSVTAQETSQMVGSILTDDLSRFKLSRVRLNSGTTDQNKANGSANVYRLSTRLVTDDNRNTTLYLNIDDARSNVLIWSRIVVIPSSSSDTRLALLPIIGEINGPHGVIASNETTLARPIDQGGYPCLLKYLEFIRFHGNRLEKTVANCLAKPVTEKALIGTMLGIRSTFEVERERDITKIAPAYARAMQYARAAVKADPNDGWTNFAMARVSYLKQDCASARFYTDRTIEANPNSAIFSAALSVFGPLCNYPDAGKLLDQALRTQSPYYPRGRLLLVFSAISQNTPEKIAQVSAGELPISRDNRSNYYLAEALIAAANGNRNEAAANWKSFEANAPAESKTADDKLRTIIMIPALRQKVIDYLKAAGVPIAEKRGDITATPVASVL
jgi:hypothetical protein